jgi:hypothetical protein
MCSHLKQILDKRSLPKDLVQGSYRDGKKKLKNEFGANSSTK